MSDADLVRLTDDAPVAATPPERRVSREDLRLLDDAIFGRIPPENAMVALDNVCAAILANEEEIRALRARIYSLTGLTPEGTPTGVASRPSSRVV